MERGSAVTRLLWLMVMVAAGMLTCTVGRQPVRHLVGGKSAWAPNVNYTQWSLHETFYVGDWLYFVFDKHMYNVLEVNKTSYEQCNEQGFIKNITRGGRDVFELTQPRPYYFLSSGGYCFNGMKLAINVVEFVPAQQPSPAKNHCPPRINGSLAVALVVVLVWVVSVSNQF